MRAEFRSYNAAYADALNEQMLLNLARLENGHPAYYLAIGSITNRFIDTAAATAGTTGQGTSTHNSHPYDVLGTATGFAQFPGRLFQTIFGYSGGAAYTHTKNPDFQFIPINNEAVARQILDPVLPDVFLTLYNQGYPIDQLMRVMIERVETTLPSGEELTLINSPGEEALTAESYARFLRGCAILREMQRLGYLTLVSRPKTESLGPISFDTPSKGARTNPTAKEFAEAEKAGFELVQVDDPDPTKGKHWEITKKQSMTIFSLKNRDAAEDVINRLAADPKLQALPGNTEQAISNVVGLLVNGIALQTKAGEARAAQAHLVLRSFDRSMKAVATEQPAFEEFQREHRRAFELIPVDEQRPILRMMWNDKNGQLAPPVQTIHYSGKTYEITDPIVNPLDAGAHWNREVFRLLVALNSQVTVDISKFQQQTFQLLPAAQ